MEFSPAPPSKAELDFEGLNWSSAREAFNTRHKDTEQRRNFLQSQTTGASVKEMCLTLQDEADNKYHKGLGGILQKIDTLMKVGDIAIKSAPESVGLAWMGIRACLHAVQGDFATFQLFSGACADIIGIMISCRVYGKMYSNTEGPEDFQELHSKVVDYIPGIYAEVLDFSYSVRKYTDKHMWIRVGKTMFGNVKGEFQSQIDNIRTHETKMRDFAKIATDRLVVYYQKEGLKNQDIISADISFMKEALDANLRANEAFIRHIEALEEERKEMRKKTPYEKAKEEFEENRKLLNPSDDQSGLWKENLDRRENGTCRWIFDLDEYKDWRASSESSMLWVSGGPGYGKSILMSSIIETLKAQRSDENDYLVQFFFCRTGDDATQTTTRILQNIVFQLYAVSESSPDLLDKTNEVMKKALNKKGADQLSSQKKAFHFQGAYDGLVKVVGRTVFLIIDALDECDDRQDKHLLRELRSVGKEAGAKIKIVVCSRPEADIGDDLNDIPTIKCEGRNEADIRKSVTAELGKFPGWTASEKTNASDEIVRKAGGQFRYVDIALNFLRKPLIRPYERALKKLPSGLTGSYVTSWEQTDSDYKDLLKTALTWTILAEGTVTVPEVMDAYSGTYGAEAGVEEEPEDPQETDVNVDLHDSQVRIAGGNFLEVSKSRVIGLRHTTVKEFFLRNEKEFDSELPDGTDGRPSKKEGSQEQAPSWILSEKIGHLELAKILAQNLSSPTFQKRYLPSNEEENLQLRRSSTLLTSGDLLEKPTEGQALVQSSADVTVPGGSDAANGNVMEDTSVKDGSQAGPAAASQEMITGINGDLSSDEATKREEESADDAKKSGQPAGEDGNNEPAQLEEPEEDFFEDNEEYIGEEEIATDWPGVKGSNQDIRYEVTHWTYHLRKAESLWPMEERQSNPDWADVLKSLASFMCNSPVAFKAWQQGQRSNYESPLFMAGYNTVYTPLQVAAAYGVVTLAEMLIDRGEDVNERPVPTMAGELVQSPLELAAAGSNIDMMKLLLEKKADPNSETNGPTAFHWAVLRGPTKESIQLFLDNGAKVNIVDGWGYNVMHYFSFSGTDPEALRALLNAGGDINIGDKMGETPLHKLVSRSDLPLDLLQAYLEGKAEVNIEDNDSQRPLYEVTLEGKTEAAKMLIENGADIHDVDKFGITALHGAALNGQTETVKLLLAKGAVANQADKKCRTPFFYACQGGHEETAQCLLEALQDLPGDEINKASSDGRTPLRKAAARGNLRIVEMILSKIDPAAAVNAKDSKLNRTPLHTAAYNGQKDVMEVLLKVGADLSLTDKDGKTPLELCGQGWARTNSNTVENALLFLIDKDEETAARCGDLLCTAAVKGSVKVIERLLAAGADPNLKDEHGWTPLLLAQQYNQAQAAEALSKRGAVIRTKPTKWVSPANYIEVSEDGLEVRSTITDPYNDTSVVSNHPIPAGVSKYYFEVEIISGQLIKPELPPVYGVGLTTMPAKLIRQMPGHFNPGARTWAWHGDDGWLFDNTFAGKEIYGGGPFSPGDVIGCAVDFNAGTMFYTKNGERLATAFEGVGGRLHPVLGMSAKVVLKGNFGEDGEGRPWIWEGWKEWLSAQDVTK